jgi:hypothetical protein
MEVAPPVIVTIGMPVTPPIVVASSAIMEMDAEVMPVFTPLMFAPLTLTPTSISWTEWEEVVLKSIIS